MIIRKRKARSRKGRLYWGRMRRKCKEGVRRKGRKRKKERRGKKGKERTRGKNIVCLRRGCLGHRSRE